MTRGIWKIAMLAALAALAWAVPARAGTYDVVACDAPGANGVNRSWAPMVDHFPVPPLQPDVFDFHSSCTTGLGVNSHSPDQKKVYYGASGFWRFTAPVGTSIIALRATRYGEVRSSADDTNTPDPENGDWDVFAQGDAGVDITGHFGPEQCASERTNGLCTVGAAPPARGSDTGLIRVAPTSTLSWGIVCAGDNLAYCWSNAGPGFGNYPLGIFWLYGATVTLEDNSAPSAAFAGDMLGGGWRSPRDSLTWSASDNSGIRTAQFLVDGVERGRANQRCDATLTVPCPNVASTTAAIGLVSDGQHELKLVASDTAGNPTTVTKSVAVDANGPQAVVKRASGKSIVVAVSDAASGVKLGGIEVRNRPADPFRPLPTTLSRGTLSAKLDRGNASKVGIRINVVDNVGNATAGQLSEMALRVHRKPLHRGSTSVAYNHAATFTGRLLTRDGVALAGQPVTIQQTAPIAAALGTVTTDSNGRFIWKAPAGTSRRFVFTFPGGADLVPLSRTARMRVRAFSTIHASRGVLRGRGTVRFSGRLGLLEAKVPPSGKLVDLQAYDRGRWRTFATARARGAKGIWRSSYKFSGIPGRYPIRVRIRREAVFPYDLGYSKPLVVLVL